MGRDLQPELRPIPTEPTEALRRGLVTIIRQLSYREGDFTLASGKKSRFYIDLKATTLHPEGAHHVGELIVRRMMESGAEIEGVGGLTLGADPIATAVSLAARQAGCFWPAFIVRKEAKDHGTSRYVEGVENLKPGARVLVLEDVVTTGGSSLKAIDRLIEAGYRPVAVCTIVDRGDGGREAIESRGLKFFSLLSLADLRQTSS